MITSIKQFRETIFKPYNLAGRQQELREQTIKMLGQPVLNGDLKVEPWMLDLDPSRVKVKKIDGDLNCRHLGLTSLPTWFQSIEEVTGWFDCSDNQLTSLEGSPQTVGGSFWCDNNRLTSLEGGPQIVGGWFYYYSNAKQFSETDIPSTTKIGGKIKFKT